MDSNNKNMYILGDEQVTGLSKLIQISRYGKCNDKYTSTAMIKSNASSFHVLSYCNNIQKSASKDDLVILCVGSNDTNPFAVLTNLSVALHKLSGFKVLIVPVWRNLYLDVRKLNNSIKRLVDNYSNCKFLKVKSSWKSKSAYLNKLCSSINRFIDCETSPDMSKPIPPFHSSPINANVDNQNSVAHSTNCNTPSESRVNLDKQFFRF
jgi:hypothetical protein